MIIDPKLNIEFLRFGRNFGRILFSNVLANAVLNLPEPCKFRPGVVHDDLKNFLETMLPKKAGKLGVSDSRIAGAISEDLEIECDFGGVVAEIIRGIR